MTETAVAETPTGTEEGGVKKGTKTGKRFTKRAPHRGGRPKNTWGKGLNFAKIEKFRQDGEMTIGTLGKMLGISTPTYYKWKKDEAAPSMATQERILQVLKGETPSTPASTEDNSHVIAEAGEVSMEPSFVTVATGTANVSNAQITLAAPNGHKNGDGANDKAPGWEGLDLLKQFIRANPERTVDEKVALVELAHQLA